ncbi:MAG TPA: hypothetical protein VMF58_04865 [Rhizomicrobium sp.]|nr:hypothetical protein [Rhizomicrobium sp.]
MGKTAYSKSLAGGFALAALTVCGGAFAADNTAAETVVVTASKVDAATLNNLSSQYVDASTALSPIKQVARWRAPVCPSVQGLPPAFNKFVADRIQAVALKVGAPYEASCKPNIEVMFTPETQKMANQVAEKTPWLFGTKLSTSAAKLATVSHPIQAWYVTATVDPSGQQRTDDPSDPVGVMGNNRKIDGSRLGAKKASVLENVVIIADAGKLAGHDVGTVADYIALLALSQVQANDGCAALPSVADAMASACSKQPAPDSITNVDVAFLKGLYATQPDALGTIARADIARRVSQDLSGQ